ncbi:hypothetical protein [Chryseosolibacter indicus]|uniref:Cytochrome c domain-containing protein n=1 Tax=Chryseosolibacter indicus TaxID=2782351 RepID=A0ABS5VR67_9BACT|nr:hypothetical protein [Chryseosolibacter indicus]MBT1703646.1 hypothetical protein [Chryseosolibacter indicus]
MQRLKISITAAIVVLVILTAGSCSNDDLEKMEDKTCSDEISYASDVNTIVQTKCAVSGCHNGSLGPQRDWTNFGTFQSRAQAVKQSVVTRQMPPAGSPVGQLTDDQIQTISCWVDQGAKNN